MKKKLAFFFFALMIFSYFFIFADIINAEQIIFNDDFEDGSFDDWTIKRNKGANNMGVCPNASSPARWMINKERLGIVIDGTDCVTEIIPNNLDLTDVDNFEFDFDWSLEESIQMDRAVVFLWQNEDNWYNLYLFGQEVLIQKLIKGEVHETKNGKGSYEFIADQIYHFKIRVTQDHQIKVFINDQLVIKAQDQTPFITGFKSLGLQGGTSLEKRSVSYFDNLVVYSLVDTTFDTLLDLTHFQQTDPNWAKETYDTAETWSKKPTLSRWGCALSSMAMILDYHNIKYLPGEIKITPSSLNNWLKNQPDGYIGEGLLNWLAVTRLTKLISDTQGTPKLEYSYRGGNDLDPTIRAIDQKQPTILQMAGHFLVGAGYNSQKNDLFIKDPAYNYSLWSEHQTELISTRLFKPSQTDLSYLLILSNPEVRLEIKDEFGNPISNVEIFTEQIIADQIEDETNPQPNSSSEQTQKYQIHQISKPASGIYTLEITTPTYQEFSLEIYTYAQTGQVTNFTQTGYANSSPTTFKLNYKKEANLNQPDEFIPENTLSRFINWTTIDQDLTQLHSQGLISKSYIYQKLKQIIAWGKETPLPTNKKRYANLLINYLTTYSDTELLPKPKKILKESAIFLLN